MQRLLPVYRADPDAYDLSSIRRFWHLASPCPPAVKQAWIDLLGPEVGLGAVRRHRTSGADLHLRRPVADPPRLGGRRRRRRDEGARRRRQRVPARRERRDLHAPLARQPADLPLHRVDREEPRRLGLARRPRLLRRRRLPLPQRPARRHVHRRRPQRLPGRDRVGAVRPPEGVVLLGRRRARRRPRPGAVRDRAGRRRSTRPPSSRSSAERIAGYKVPRTVEFTDTPLRDDAGKARRSAVRDDVIARQARARS